LSKSLLFFLTKNRQIYKAIKELKRKREEVNMLSIKEQIKGKDIEILTYISKIAESKYGTSLEYAYKKLKELTEGIKGFPNRLLKAFPDLEKQYHNSFEKMKQYRLQEQAKRKAFKEKCKNKYKK